MTGPSLEDVPELAEWLELSESLLRGLVHSLNNRITALSAFAELAEMGDTEFTAASVLPGEMARLQELNGLFRLLVPDDPAPAAIELGPVLSDAVALHGHHARLRTVSCDVVRTDQALPVRAPRWALLRLLLLIVEEGKRSADRDGRGVTRLHVGGDERWIVLHVDGGTLSPYAAAMARRCGAEDSMAGDAVIRLPTLLELRRRERAGPAESR